MGSLLKTLSTLISIAFVIVLVHSCSEDDNKVNSADLSSQLKIRFDKLYEMEAKESYSKKSDELVFLKNSNFLLEPFQAKARASEFDIETISIQTSVVNRDNLNDVFSLIDKSRTVLALTLLEDENKICDGLIIHYSDNKGNLKLEAFKKGNESCIFEYVDFPANLVSTFTLNNLLFVARSIFPSRDITTFGVSDINNVEPTNKYDDISLLRFASKYNLLQFQSTLKGDNISGQIVISKQSRINNPELPGFEDGGGSEPCAVAVHHCHNGTPRLTSCQPFAGGCREPLSCGYSATLSELQTNQMSTESQIFESNLSEETLYSFRDWLNNQQNGQFYHDAYYSMSPHFQETLDLELLYDLTVASADMSSFVSALLADSQSYNLDEVSFNKFVSIANESSQKSQSTVYQDLVAIMINDVQIYKTKSVQQIKTLLSE